MLSVTFLIQLFIQIHGHIDFNDLDKKMFIPRRQTTAVAAGNMFSCLSTYQHTILVNALR